MSDWKKTLNLPRTGFPMRANLQTAEPAAIARWNEMGLYARIRKQRAGAPQFILHDGPPYANGPIHIGHVLNKVLKDIRRQVADDGGVRCAVCAGLGLSRVADRAEGGERARPEEARDERGRLPPRLRAVRGEVRRAAVGRFPAARYPRRLGPTVSDDDARLPSGHRAGPGPVRRAESGLQGQKAGALVSALPHRARRGGGGARKPTPRGRSTSSFR